MASPDVGPVDLPLEVAPGDPMPGEEAVYLFALVDGAAAFGEGSVTTGGESDPFSQPIIHRAGPIAALISMVPFADYCGADAARHLSDLPWLAPRTMYHAAVPRQAMQSSPVYPVPFATLFASRDSLSAFMQAHAPTLGGFFRAVAGMAEWELKASARLDRREALEALARDAWPNWGQLTPGTRYLRLCRDRPGLIAAGRALAQGIAARLARRLQPPATSLCHLSLHPAPESDSGELVGRFALLVPLAGASALAQTVQKLADEAAAAGIALSLSGPWPPFSFRPDLPRPSRPEGA